MYDPSGRALIQIAGQDVAYYDTNPVGPTHDRLNFKCDSLNELFTSVFYRVLGDVVRSVAIIFMMLWMMGVLTPGDVDNGHTCLFYAPTWVQETGARGYDMVRTPHRAHKRISPKGKKKNKQKTPIRSADVQDIQCEQIQTYFSLH